MKALFGFALMTAFLPNITSAGTLPRWAVLAVALVGLLFCRSLRITWAHIAGALFVGWAMTSLAWSPAWYDGIGALLPLLILAGIFALGSTLQDMRPFYLGAAAGIGVSSALVLADLAGFHPIPGQWGGGLFVNPLFMAEAAALVGVAIAGDAILRRGPIWPLLALLPAIGVPLMSTARGPALAIGAAGMVLIWRRWPRLWPILVVLMLDAAVLAILARPSSVTERFDLWSDTISGLTWLGHSYGSFFGVFPEYAAHYTPVRFNHAHSLLLETAFELGPIGLVLLGWLVWLLRGPINTERLVMVAFLVESLFAFPDRLPATAGFIAFVAGRIARGLPYWRDALDPWRIGVCPRDGYYLSPGFDGCADYGGRVVAIRLQDEDSIGPSTGRAEWPCSEFERIFYRGPERRSDG